MIRKSNIPNVVRYDQTTGAIKVIVTRRNGNQYTVTLDPWVYHILIRGAQIHCKPIRHGLDKFYPAFYFDGALTYIHQMLWGYAAKAVTKLTSVTHTVDHRNPTDPLDCRLSNLRSATNKQQRANQCPRTKKSKVNG